MLAPLLATAALAAPLPPDAATAPLIPAGSTFEVLALDKQDAYYPTDKRRIAGLRCTADEDLRLNDPRGFYGGPATCGDGDRYFFMVAIRVLHRAEARPAPIAEAVAPIGGGADPDVATIGARHVVRITDIHEEDAYYGSKSELIGLTCVTGDEGLHENAPGFYGGAATCNDGSDRYFFKAAVDAALKDLPTDHPFVIFDLHPEDAYNNDRKGLIGRSCVSTGPLTARDGWYGGNATCGDDSFVFFKVAIADQGPPAPVVSETPPFPAPESIPAGSTVVLRAIAADDAYAGQSGMIGKTCVTRDTLVADQGWSTGSVTCDGTAYVFYHASFEVTAVGTGATDSRYRGPRVSRRSEVRIVAIGPDDGWAYRAEDLVGQSCVAKQELPAVGDGWYSGLLMCSGARLMFTEVAVELR